jgi:hypothetical protein
MKLLKILSSNHCIEKFLSLLVFHRPDFLQASLPKGSLLFLHRHLVIFFLLTELPVFNHYFAKECFTIGLVNSAGNMHTRSRQESGWNAWEHPGGNKDGNFDEPGRIYPSDIRVV